MPLKLQQAAEIQGNPVSRNAVEQNAGIEVLNGAAGART
jgi:hypothetical protein